MLPADDGLKKKVSFSLILSTAQFGAAHEQSFSVRGLPAGFTGALQVKLG